MVIIPNSQTQALQSYQHMETGRYIHIDGRDGQFYDRDRNPISEKQGLDVAMPAGQVHSHSFGTGASIKQGYGLGLC